MQIKVQIVDLELILMSIPGVNFQVLATKIDFLYLRASGLRQVGLE